MYEVSIMTPAKLKRLEVRAHAAAIIGPTLSISLLLLSTGCSQMMPDRAERMTQGYVFFLDGAGGGSTVFNWSAGLRKGLLDAGYNGAGEMFKWNTGRGIVADQDASVEYKRSKAAECAQRIQQYVKDHPGAPVTLVGLSAGSAVTVFTLEELPSNCPVETVILCGASISANYDLTRALQRVRNRCYVFTSEKDSVLAFLVPMAGTADRQHGVPSAGLRGFDMPSPASTETRAQYTKVSHIPWRPEFKRFGDSGEHTDTLKAPFVQEYMAPLIMAGMARGSAVETTTEKVRNPDYERWATLSPGAWITFEGYQVLNGEKQQLRLTAKLISKHDNRLVVERTYVTLQGGNAEHSRVQTFVMPAEIHPADHPLTSPTARIEALPPERLTIAGNALNCTVRNVQAAGEFPEYGKDIWATISQNENIPGGMAKVWLKSNKSNQPFEFRGDVVGYGVR